MKVQGRIVNIKDTQVITEKFKKRDLWIETVGEYPQTLNVQFTQAKTDVLDSYTIGQEVEIDINLRGRIWEDKCFNTIEGWRINAVGGQSAPQPQVQVQDPVDEEGDVPF